MGSLEGSQEHHMLTGLVMVHGLSHFTCPSAKTHFFPSIRIRFGGVLSPEEAREVLELINRFLQRARERQAPGGLEAAQRNSSTFPLALRTRATSLKPWGLFPLGVSGGTQEAIIARPL